MRNILEQSLVHLLNDEHDKASALMHKFMVARARQIHESLRQGDDVLNDGWDDEITTESYFTEADLEDFEDEASAEAGVEGDDVAADVDGGEGAEFGGEVEGDVDAEAGEGDDMGVDDAAADLEGDLGVEGDEVGDTEERIEDLEDRLEALKAEFEEMMAANGEDVGDDMADDEAGVDADAEFGGDAEGDAVDADVDGDADADLVDGMEDDMKDPVDEAEDFSSLSESIAAELEKISISLSDGKEVAAGGSVSTNGKSPISGAAKADDRDASPAAPKAESNTSFERETAPASKDPKKARNTKAKATDGQSTVSKEGDKGALLNKDFAGKAAK